jgi:hypothetical protein
MSPNDDEVDNFNEHVPQSDIATDKERTGFFNVNQAMWNNNGFQKRYAGDRCRGHKLRCNRDPSAPSSQTCQRCIKAKSDCTISSSFLSGKMGLRKQENSKRSQTDHVGYPGKQKKRATKPLDVKSSIPQAQDICRLQRSFHRLLTHSCRSLTDNTK